MQCIYEGEPPRVMALGCVRRIWQQLVGAWLAATTLGCFQVVDQQLVFSAFQRPRGKTPGFAELLADDTGANSCLRLGRSMPDDWLPASFASLRNDDLCTPTQTFPKVRRDQHCWATFSPLCPRYKELQRIPCVDLSSSYTFLLQLKSGGHLMIDLPLRRSV